MTCTCFGDFCGEVHTSAENWAVTLDEISISLKIILWNFPPVTVGSIETVKYILIGFSHKTAEIHSLCIQLIN